jgi:hypothetical protein
MMGAGQPACMGRINEAVQGELAMVTLHMLMAAQ